MELEVPLDEEWDANGVQEASDDGQDERPIWERLRHQGEVGEARPAHHQISEEVHDVHDTPGAASALPLPAEEQAPRLCDKPDDAEREDEYQHAVAVAVLHQWRVATHDHGVDADMVEAVEVRRLVPIPRHVVVHRRGRQHDHHADAVRPEAELLHGRIPGRPSGVAEDRGGHPREAGAGEVDDPVSQELAARILPPRRDVPLERRGQLALAE
mmetsp:Transcript_70189/g.196720  ORF Transcript_70189/g.196720 Transcript_70189/m.196720 type:complete len:213 (+) Transcript_70189:174-812(+)